MSVKRIIQEALDKNPLGLKEAFEEELSERVRLALEEIISESKNMLDESVSDAAAAHHKVIDKISSHYGNHDGPHWEKDHHDLQNLHHSHRELSKIHDAHATIHRANGNHAAAAAHEEAAADHRTLATVSHPNYTPSRGVEHETHEEYEHASGQANNNSKDVLKKHPLGKNMKEELEDFMESEEFEQLDEISKKTLSSYVKKAERSADRHFDKAGMALAKSQDASERASKSDTDRGYDYHKDREAKHYDKFRQHDRVHQKRAAGIAAAKKRLNKEEVELDEISQETLRNYHAKAGASMQKAKSTVQKGMDAKKLTPAGIKRTGDAYKTYQKRVKGLNRAADKMED